MPPVFPRAATTLPRDPSTTLIRVPPVRFLVPFAAKEDTFTLADGPRENVLWKTRGPHEGLKNDAYAVSEEG